ncbi:hypothetical protein [Gaetbulibacter sp. PBL-D1]|uniref:hypothetical protein n=1 Tax=Gaetbulibacter sp. PBL-D1 TaxID=3422594 RepID=UPI003D2EB904
MDDLKKNEAIKFIKNKIHKEKKGHCGVRYALTQVTGNKEHLKDIDIKDVASKITSSGKYKKEKSGNETRIDFDISLNPDSNLIKRNPLATEIIRIVIAFIVALLTAYFTTIIKLNTESQSEYLEQKKSNMQEIEPKVYNKQEQDSSISQ